MATSRVSYVLAAAAAVALLAGCGSAASGGYSGGTEAASTPPADGGGASDSSLNCDAVTDPAWELFTDPRLTVDPATDVASLAKEGDVVKFTDTSPVGFTTYSYSLGYVDDKGSVFLSQAAIFVGAEDSGSFELAGPVSPSGIVGGPYAGVLQIEATNDAGITPLARICVLLAASD